jgi:hypothetical protein
VTDHAKDQVLNMFHEMKQARYQAHISYLQTLPCYTIYQKFGGHPPLDAPQVHVLNQQISHAQAIFQAQVDDDWRRSCMRYPEILDYYFRLIAFQFPEDEDASITQPRFGQSSKEPKRLKTRRESMDVDPPRRKRSRRRNSRGRTPPPSAPMAGHYRR